MNKEFDFERGLILAGCLVEHNNISQVDGYIEKISITCDFSNKIYFEFSTGELNIAVEDVKNSNSAERNDLEKLYLNYLEAEKVKLLKHFYKHNTVYEVNK